VQDLYSDCLHKSTLFVNQASENLLVDSIIRFFTISIFLPQEMINVVGNIYEELFIILEG
jgi:negative regulator of sigma E activity